MNTNTSLYFQPNELEDLFRDATLKRSSLTERQNFEDEYQFFIWQCKQKTYPKGTLFERHHILPKHAGGTNGPSNIITLSIKDHITAHWLRWKVYNSIKDLKAFEFRVSNSAEKKEDEYNSKLLKPSKRKIKDNSKERL